MGFGAEGEGRGTPPRESVDRRSRGSRGTTPPSFTPSVARSVDSIPTLPPCGGQGKEPAPRRRGARADLKIKRGLAMAAPAPLWRPFLAARCSNSRLGNALVDHTVPSSTAGGAAGRCGRGQPPWWGRTLARRKPPGPRPASGPACPSLDHGARTSTRLTSSTPAPTNPRNTHRQQSQQPRESRRAPRPDRRPARPHFLRARRGCGRKRAAVCAWARCFSSWASW